MIYSLQTITDELQSNPGKAEFFCLSDCLIRHFYDREAEQACAYIIDPLRDLLDHRSNRRISKRFWSKLNQSKMIQFEYDRTMGVHPMSLVVPSAVSPSVRLSPAGRALLSAADKPIQAINKLDSL